MQDMMTVETWHELVQALWALLFAAILLCLLFAVLLLVPCSASAIRKGVDGISHGLLIRLRVLASAEDRSGFAALGTDVLQA